MDERQYTTSNYTTAEAIKSLRKRLGLTQKDFAILINCSKPTVERWETSKEPITGPIVLLLEMLNRHPEYAEEIRLPEMKYPIRLLYMHKQTVCTVIDVDEAKRKLKIKNYTDDVMFRAFGVVENPTFEMYTDFLESRCFPRSRDKMKLILKDLDLPFYDPFLIIEKTEGRMAEDDFWIQIVR